MMFWKDGQPTIGAQAALMVAMKLTLARSAEPEQFLIAMLNDEISALSKTCVKLRPGVGIAILRDTIIASSRDRSGQALADSAWSSKLISDRTAAVLKELIGSPAWQPASLEEQQRLFAAAMVDAAIPRVKRVFGNMGLDPTGITASLRRSNAEKPPKPAPFDENGRINQSAFAPSGRAILSLLETEGKGLGLNRIGTPLLLFAHVARENGLLEKTLRLQLIDPKRTHENLLVHLRSLGNRRFNAEFALVQDRMQPAAIRAFEKAADYADEMDLPAIGEAELLKGLLFQNDPFVTSFFETLKVNAGELSAYVMQRHSGEDDESEDEASLPSLNEIEARLRERIVGQDHVIQMVMPILKRMRFGYTRPHRPLAVLLFLGNSGTGKTQLAKEIANAMYGSEDQLIFLEMGQFGTEQSKNIFVGAPPGYVGYGEGLLTNGLRDKPESVVLFDEVEKAHRSVFDVLLRFLDEGQISDPAGPVRDGRRCIIVLTSNHALDMLQSLIDRQSEMKQLPHAEREAAKMEVRNAILATGFFRPEFLNRVDELVLFNTFDADAYRKIVHYVLETERLRFQKEKSLNFTVDELLHDELTRQCVARSGEGARVCGKLVGDVVISALIDYFLDPQNEGVQSVRVSYSLAGHVQIVPQPAG